MKWNDLKTNKRLKQLFLSNVDFFKALEYNNNVGEIYIN